MQRKSAITKSASRRKSRPVSWSTDDVYSLLKAVNEITLRRMEDQTTRIENLLKTVNVTTQRDYNIGLRLDGTVLPRMEQAIQAIKTRVGALAGRYSKRRAA